MLKMLKINIKICSATKANINVIKSYYGSLISITRQAIKRKVNCPISKKQTLYLDYYLTPILHKILEKCRMAVVPKSGETLQSLEDMTILSRLLYGLLRATY